MKFIIIRCTTTEEMRSMQESLWIKHPDAFYKIETIDKSSLKTAYEIAKAHNGFEGSKEDFIAYCHKESGEAIDLNRDRIKAAFYRDDRLAEQYGMDNLAYDLYVHEVCKSFI